MFHKFYYLIIATWLLAACTSPSPTTPLAPAATPTNIVQPTNSPMPQSISGPTTQPIQPTSLSTQVPSETPTLASSATPTPAATATKSAPTATPSHVPQATATNAQTGSDLSTIPVPKGTALIESGSKALTYQTNLSVEAVAKYYQSMPPTNGWSYASTDHSSVDPTFIALMHGTGGMPAAILTIQSSMTSPNTTEILIRSFP